MYRVSIGSMEIVGKSANLRELDIKICIFRTTEVGWVLPVTLRGRGRIMDPYCLDSGSVDLYLVQLFEIMRCKVLVFGR